MLRDMFKKTYTMIDTKRISGERPAGKGRRSLSGGACRSVAQMQ